MGTGSQVFLYFFENPTPSVGIFPTISSQLHLTYLKKGPAADYGAGKLQGPDSARP